MTSIYAPELARLAKVEQMTATEKLFTVEMPEGRRCLITTSKDAVRLTGFENIAARFDYSAYYLPIGIRFLNDDADEFNNFITRYVRKNRTDNRVPQEEGDN